MQLTSRSKALAATFIGALLPLAFAPFDAWILAPVCLAVLFWLLRDASPKEAFFRALLFGFTSFLFGTYWTWISVHDISGAPIFLSIGATVGLAIALASFFAVAAALAVRWLPSSGAFSWLLGWPAIWCIAEWCRHWMFTGFGWLSIGYSQTDTWLMAYVPVFGLHGVSLAVALIAGALVALLFASARERRIALIMIAGIVGSAWLLGNRNWSEPRPQLVSVALAQGAVSQEEKWDYEQYEPTLALYRQLTLEAAGADIIVWPEVAIPNVYANTRDYLDETREILASSNSTVILGILYRGADADATVAPQNAVVGLTPLPQFYVKRHLVPFGEYFPVPSFARNWLQLLDLPYSDLVPGSKNQPLLEVAGERIAVTICYEDVFGSEQLDFFPDATLIVNVSNDAWFGDSIAADQHLQIARVRAAEVGRYSLRATNTGISAVIDPRGRIVSQAPKLEPAIVRDTVQGFTGSTPYVFWRNYPVLLFVFAVVLYQFVTTKLTMRPGT